MSNSLASVHPELIPEWSERNLPLTPDKITFGSNKRVWWKLPSEKAYAYKMRLEAMKSFTLLNVCQPVFNTIFRKSVKDIRRYILSGKSIFQKFLLEIPLICC